MGGRGQGGAPCRRAPLQGSTGRPAAKQASVATWTNSPVRWGKHRRALNIAIISVHAGVGYLANHTHVGTRRFIMDAHVYKTIQVTGTSASSADDAVQTAV